jgi:hypothetical protein
MATTLAITAAHLGCLSGLLTPGGGTHVPRPAAAQANDGAPRVRSASAGADGGSVRDMHLASLLLTPVGQLLATIDGIRPDEFEPWHEEREAAEELASSHGVVDVGGGHIPGDGQAQGIDQDLPLPARLSCLRMRADSSTVYQQWAALAGQRPSECAVRSPARWSEPLVCSGPIALPRPHGAHSCTHCSPRSFRPCFSIFSRSFSSPSINPSGRGGQPGMYTSTGTSMSTPCTV